MVFESEEDARLHPDKTRLLRFEPPAKTKLPNELSTQRGRSFDLLGMTLYWNKSRRGRWVVTQKTAKARFRRGLRRLSLWCKEHRHDPVEEQQRALSRKLQGHYAYTASPGTSGRSCSFSSRQSAPGTSG